MIGLDTNILVRYLVEDDPVQSPKAKKIIEHDLMESHPGFISLVTMAETIWVLNRIYRLSNSELATVVERMLAADTLSIQNEQEVFSAMISLKTGTGSFADALIGALGSPNVLVRESGARALGQIGPEARSAVPGLTAALRDPEWTVRRHAALALGMIGPPARSALPALEGLGRDASRPVREAARGAVTKIRP